MARPRKPTALHELKGAFVKDPQRRCSREREPIAEGDGGFDAGARAKLAVAQPAKDEDDPGEKYFAELEQARKAVGGVRRE